MRLYIAGPMTGIPRFNFPAFIEMADRLRDTPVSDELGGRFDVVSPAELDDPVDRQRAFDSPDGSPIHYENGHTWGDFLARDVKLLADDGIEAIVVLPGWENSKGARLETFVGYALMGKPICEVTWVADMPVFEKVSDFRLVKAWAGSLWSAALDGWRFAHAR